MRDLSRLLAGVSALVFTACPAMAQQIIDGGETITIPDGSSNSWIIADSLIVGFFSEGTLRIETGGRVENAAGIVSYMADGTVEVTGEGAEWINSSSLNVGYGSTGTLTIAAGGRVESSDGGIGYNGNGTVVVTGENSIWVIAGDEPDEFGELDIGIFGTGGLTIADGGRVESTVGYLGYLGTSSGAVTVTGEDSIWTNTGAISVGFGATGKLTVANGGAVSAGGGIDIASQDGAIGTLIIGSDESEPATAAGALDTDEIRFGLGEGAIIFNHTDTGYAFDIPITGYGAIYQGAGRTIFNIDQPDFTGFSSVYGGVLEVNGALGGVMNVFGGTLAGIGAVGPTTHVGGNIAPGIPGVNNGLGDLIIEGDYTADGGGALLIETMLGEDDSLTDRLIINGDTQFGTNNTDGIPTQVFVTNLGGSGGQTVDGIRIIEVAGDSTPGLFELGAPAIAGAYSYSLFQGLPGQTPDLNDGDWYLRSAGFAPTVSNYEALPSVLLGMTELPTLQQRVGDRYWPGANAATGYAGPRNLWTRIEGAHGHVEGDSTTGAAYDADRFLVQVGIDGLLAENGSGMLIGGFNAQYGRVNADIDSVLGGGDNSADSYGVGATLTWYGANGIYVDGQASVARLSSDLDANAVGELVDGNDGVGYAFSIEAGRKLPVRGNWSLTPQVQLAYASVDFDDFTDPFGANVSLDSGDSLKGRLGVALDYDTGTTGEGRSHVYGVANLTYEFLDGTAVDVAGVEVALEPDSFGAEVGLGGTYRWAGGKYALYGEALASTSFEGSYGAKGTVGFSTAF